MTTLLAAALLAGISTADAGYTYEVPVAFVRTHAVTTDVELPIDLRGFIDEGTIAVPGSGDVEAWLSVPRSALQRVGRATVGFRPGAQDALGDASLDLRVPWIRGDGDGGLEIPIDGGKVAVTLLVSGATLDRASFNVLTESLQSIGMDRALAQPHTSNYTAPRPTVGTLPGDPATIGQGPRRISAKSLPSTAHGPATFHGLDTGDVRIEVWVRDVRLDLDLVRE